MLIVAGRDLNQVYASTEVPQPRRGNSDVCLLRQALIDAVADLDPERDALKRSSRRSMLTTHLLMDVKKQCCERRQPYVQ